MDFTALNGWEASGHTKEFIVYRGCGITPLEDNISGWRGRMLQS